MSLAAVSIVTKLLMKNPSQRLGSSGSFNAFQQHPFFKGMLRIILALFEKNTIIRF
jgi:hypothetical protein